MAKVSLKSVTKVYPAKKGKGVPAVNALNLEIQDREFVVLVGPPGCGISSVMRMIAGLEEVSKGDIFIGDRRVNDLAPGDRDIGMVLQGYVPYPRMSVSDNLAFALTLRKFPKAEIKKRVLAAAGLFGIQELLERKPEALSSEQRQRVAVARVVALQPRVFLFDGALAELDAKANLQMRNEIAKLHQRLQATMIYATHDPIEAMAMGGRIVVINDGVVQQDGTAQSLYDEPANSFVAEFIGSPMNLIQGTLKQDRDSFVFKEREGGTIEVRLPISEFLGAREFAGGSVLLGIRPEWIEAVEITQTANKQPDSFPAIVERVEPTGREANLYLQTGAHTVVCRTKRPADPQEAGRRGRFELKLGKVCLFDPVSTRRII